MVSLSKEIKNIQNPALGGYLLSIFVNEYYVNSDKFPPLQLLFVVYPLIYINDLFEIINSTKKPTGLRGCMDKLKENKNNDIILHVQTVVLNNKTQIMDCIRFAMLSGFISVDKTGEAIPLYDRIKEIKISSKDIEKLQKVSKKLGVWFSELNLVEISQILKVRF
ncbi:MAG: hypothetical protein IJT23_09100 [Clostridia bacterium]|nr:hypothetical protein [Clostridia bacterium]